MNPQDSEQPDSESRSGDASADAVEAPKPRKRRSTKAAAADAAPQVSEAVPAPAPEPEAAAPAKPKRTRRKPAADDGVQAVMFAEEPAAEPAALPEPAVAKVVQPAVSEIPSAEPVAEPAPAKKRASRAKAKPVPVDAVAESQPAIAPTVEDGLAPAVAVAVEEPKPVSPPAPAPSPVVEPLTAPVAVAQPAAAEPAAVFNKAAAAEPQPVFEPVRPAAVQRDADSDAEPADAASQAESAEANDGPAAEGGEAEGPRRRNRNRRRGRRGNGDKAAAGAPAEADGNEGQPSVATAAAPQVSADDDDEDDDAPAAAPSAPLPPVDAGETFADVLSGAYDAVPAEDIEAIPERRVLAAEPDAPKLHKVLAQAGIGSRRDMEQLIADGQVTVNGQPAHTGQRISFGDQIRIQGKPVKVRIAPPLPRVIAYHKPVGEVVTHDDPQHRPTVFRRLPRLPQGKWQSVGRLDINTEGLLLFTNSGEMANQLMHPRFGVEREYAVRVLGTLDQEGRDSLLEGVEIEGQRAAFKSIADGGGEGVNHWYRVVITEGRNREVRKLFDSVGLAVSRLIRIRYGCVVLPRGLKRGVYVDLNEAEVRELRRMAGGRDQREGQGGGGRPQQQGQDGGGKSRRNRRGGQQGRDRGNDRPERNNDRGGYDRPPFERREPGENGPIPNPLQQTFDKRAIREASRQPRREYSEDGPIPNPLEQTYDKRFVQKQRGPGGGGRNRGGDQGGNGGQPDPMKTSVGYIGADAFVRKFQGNGGGGGGGGGGRGGRRRGGR